MPWHPREREKLRGQVEQVEGNAQSGYLLAVRCERTRRLLIVNGRLPGIRRHLVNRVPVVGEELFVKRQKDSRAGIPQFRVIQQQALGRKDRKAQAKRLADDKGSS